MIKTKFNEIKTTQAASLILERNNNELNYMKLIKLLYLIDREALNRWERTLTGDNYFSMKHGPVLSSVLDFINNNFHDESYWYQYISEPYNYKVKLQKSTQYNELNNAEIELIKEIDNKYKSKNEWDMVEIVHNECAEWEYTDSALRIDIEDILKSLKKTQLEIYRIENEINSMEYVRGMLNC